MAKQLNQMAMCLLRKNAIPQSFSFFFTGIASGCSVIAFFETPTAATDCAKCADVAICV